MCSKISPSSIQMWRIYFLEASIRSSTVAGFLPRRFFFTQNLPKPEINTCSPVSSVRLISSGNISTLSIDFLRVNPFFSATSSMMWDLVSVPGFGVKAFFHEGDFKLIEIRKEFHWSNIVDYTIPLFCSSGLTQLNFMIGMGQGIIDGRDWVKIKIVGDLALTFQVSGVSVAAGRQSC